jgi:BCCT family betaine/carnitine transporter
MSSNYETDHEVGENNILILGFDIHNPVFAVSALLVIGFVLGTLMFPDVAKSTLDAAKAFSINSFDWLFMSASNVFVLFCLALMFLPTGNIRIGGDQAVTDFSRLSWFAMLFAAGMGIGLMFWSVAEPVAYYTDWWGTPLGSAAHTDQGAQMVCFTGAFILGLFMPWLRFRLHFLPLIKACH